MFKIDLFFPQCHKVIVRYVNKPEWVLALKIMLLMTSDTIQGKRNIPCRSKVAYLNANSLEKSVAGISGCPSDSHKKANIFIG